MESLEPLVEFLRAVLCVAPGEQYEDLLVYFSARLNTWDREFIRHLRDELDARADYGREIITLAEIVEGHLAVRELVTLKTKRNGAP